jgi:aspartate-semialdehyde dehydrogenase
MMASLKQLQLKSMVKGVVAPTYQTVIGGVKDVIDELDCASVLAFEGNVITLKILPIYFAIYCIPYIDILGEEDYTKEELKMILQALKILSTSDLNISATCVRVPILIRNAESFMITFTDHLTAL